MEVEEACYVKDSLIVAGLDKVPLTVVTHYKKLGVVSAVDKRALKAPNTHSSLSWCWVSVDSTSQPPLPRPQRRPQPLPSLSLLSLTVSLSASDSKLFPIGVAFSSRVLQHQPPRRSVSGLHLLTDNGNTKDDLRLPTDDDLLTQGKDLVVSVMSVMGEEQICALKDIGPKN
ncbi:hypothetical protein PIB30_084858 [Stylosanthes scabra]|uniref:Translation initiation factor 5A C-terminal domain-containing protein n=1 Tax=Stylosanthes scabra TaxID=79078 RepID=A0ABU6ZRE3_9FABA|nr:hypothetical protein [Stylosanthes scabra]